MAELKREIEVYGPTVSVPVLVAELNRLYHRHEASSYNRAHPEIFCQLPELWREMLQVGQHFCRREPLRVLDFGCGTGFAAQQCLATLGDDRIAHLVCYDPSPEMLKQCRARLRNCRRVTHVTNRSAIFQLGISFDLLLTNSVLHHLTDPAAEIRSLGGVLAAEATWVCGHEPSVRFLRNPHCRALYDAYCRHRRWRRYLSPHSYWLKLAALCGPSRRTAHAAFQQGLFRRRPPSELISQLVDYHVVHPQSPDNARGFDVAALKATFHGDWVLRWLRTYSYMGPYYEPTLPRSWRKRAHNLAAAFPLDGANTCTVWQRVW